MFGFLAVMDQLLQAVDDDGRTFLHLVSGPLSQDELEDYFNISVREFKEARSERIRGIASVLPRNVLMRLCEIKDTNGAKPDIGSTELAVS